MGRSSAEVKRDLLKLQDTLNELLEVRGALIFVDLQYFADKSKDLKQELRIAEAREN